MGGAAVGGLAAVEMVVARVAAKAAETEGGVGVVLEAGLAEAMKAACQEGGAQVVVPMGPGRQAATAKGGRAAVPTEPWRRVAADCVAPAMGNKH